MNQSAPIHLLSITTVIDTFARVLVYALVALSIYACILLLLRSKTKVALASLSPERRHHLNVSASRIVKLLWLSLIVLPVLFALIIIILHVFLGANLVWLIALFGLLIINLVGILIDQNWLAKESSDDANLINKNAA
jgi:hypothetical protein